MALIPKEAAEHFAAAFEAFVDAAALAAEQAGPESQGTPMFAAWRAHVLPLLQKQKGDVAEALRLFRAGDFQALVLAAEDKRGLAKDMDGFFLDFAGPGTAEELGRLRAAVVAAACEVCQSSGVS